MMMNFISVAIGGALGAMLRYGISLAVTAPAIGLPAFVATLGVNVAGCAMMGIMAAALAHFPYLSTALPPLIMIGFLGALTTFSSFALDGYYLLEKQQYMVMALYLLGSFALSLGAFFTLFNLTRWGLS